MLFRSTLYLGTPLVEQGIVSHDTCVTLLRRLREQTTDLWYRPHPREDAAHVAQLVDEVGMQPFQADSIIEYGLLRAGWVPEHVTATHSSALDTLRVILGDTVTVQAIPLPNELVAQRWRDWMTRAYAEMDARLGIPVERLELL